MRVEKFAVIAAAIALEACEERQGAGLNVESACLKTAMAYAHARDAIDPDAYGALFTEDARFTFAGATTEGRAAIVENLLERGPALPTRHIVGSAVVDVIDETRATGRSYAIVFTSGAGAEFPTDELNGDSLMAVVTYEDEYRVEDGACRIASRRTIIDMRGF